MDKLYLLHGNTTQYIKLAQFLLNKVSQEKCLNTYVFSVTPILVEYPGNVNVVHC